MVDKLEQNSVPEDESERTLLAPLFDKESALRAQPVIPLDEQPPVIVAHPATVYGVPSRRSWPLALVLVSVLVGSVLGGVGLRFYQQHQQKKAASQQQQQTPAPVEMPQPTPLVEDRAVVAPAPAPAGVVEETKADAPPVTTATPRETRDDDDDTSGKSSDDKRRGKDEDERETRPRRTNVPRSEPAPRPVGTPAPAREVPEQPRASRRRENVERREQRSIDRVRAIFEGQPER